MTICKILLNSLYMKYSVILNVPPPCVKYSICAQFLLYNIVFSWPHKNATTKSEPQQMPNLL